ncbi:MAG TPA: ABC transporter ATP-binding protein [Lactobacillaceae bacterium]|jgi:ABC-2 type transport system ATP-binding protein
MTTIVHLENVHYGLGGQAIFENLQLDLSSGKFIALLGENGTGKTTLMRIISGLAKQVRGTRQVPDLRQISYVPDLQGYKHRKIKDVLTENQWLFANFSKERAETLMAFMQLNPNAKVDSLSKGNLEKLTLVLTLARDAELYLLDEPLSGVDIGSRKKIINALLQWVPETGTVLISTHHVNEMSAILDEVIVLKDGEVMRHVETEAVREQGLSLIDVYQQVYGEV